MAAIPYTRYEFAAYPFPVFANIAVAGNQQQTLQIASDADFEIMQIAQHTMIAYAAYTQNTRPVPNYLIQLADSTNKYIFGNNQPIPLTAVCGQADQMPYFLPQSYILKASATLNCTLYNIDAAVATYDVYITLVGRKCYLN